MVFLGSHLLSIYYSVTRENFSVVSTENSVFYLLIFVKAVKIESSWLDLRPVSAPPPPPHPLPLITLLTVSGTWDQEETKMAAEGHASLKPELSSVSTVCFELQYRGLNG